ncbi:hypothetical protein HQ529_02310 [Candidatus Woesearchaeota archaeon]|nr:hypothetical protein [Candidatus Woesearchaeota archaeon]
MIHDNSHNLRIEGNVAHLFPYPALYTSEKEVLETNGLVKEIQNSDATKIIINLNGVSAIRPNRRIELLRNLGIIDQALIDSGFMTAYTNSTALVGYEGNQNVPENVVDKIFDDYNNAVNSLND